MRGIAKVALARGDRDGARKQYERILGKSLIGRGPPAEHWAHSEYAWLLFESGELAVRSPLACHWTKFHSWDILRQQHGTAW